MLSLKWERFQDSDVTDLEILSSDWQKLALLQNNRIIQFHGADGRYHEIKTPRFGRKLLYDGFNCELYITSDQDQTYRFSLESGRFLEPLTSKLSYDIECINQNKETGLIMTGSKNGVVEAWDNRVRKSVATFYSRSDLYAEYKEDIMEDFSSGQKFMNVLNQNSESTGKAKNEENQLNEVTGITALETHGALDLAIGYSTGHVFLYDIRSSSPKLHKNLRYGQGGKMEYFFARIF